MSDGDFDRRAMEIAIGLGMRGRGCVEPNPMVGCVIARDQTILATGYHEKLGGPHAEPMALAALKESAAGATVYVTLEPCCHLTKRTPPCVPKLIAAKVARVKIGCRDPNPLVSGQGIAELRAAGIAVEENLLEDQCRQLNAAFFKHFAQRRPYVTLKWAQTADQKIAGPGGKRLAITDDASNHIVHRLRSLSDAMLVGINTILIDDPLLTARNTIGGEQPIRVILDTHLRMPPSAKIIAIAEQSPVLIYCCPAAKKRGGDLEKLSNVSIEPIPLDSAGHISLPHVLNDLGGREITNLLVEPGPKLARAFIEQNLADRTWIFHSPIIVNELSAPSAAATDYPIVERKRIDHDELTECLNPRSEVFFGIFPSADFRLLNNY